ncbi:mycobactin polyketide synthetase MbtD [Mycolicibacterium rutilum]|uniref:Mycobactin polyketide synthetase MbtD n=1 Tax=Mycolicibacterium rutilum TaxID=370526 RepID=A0A1H6KMB2_MYCRU|nr:mycobactin polyketide synthase MbtD [Mycolicibacterium rutilum]SEH73963.1 mycobactin polyketide synthetase MbtD [Mycolicibacterium rutilum]
MTPGTGLPDGRVPVLLSAHAAELLAQDAAAILRYLDRKPDVGAVAATLLRTRRPRRHRAVIRAADTAELADALRALASGQGHPLIARSSASAAPRTAFVFPGQGNQWPAMGADAYRTSAVYRAEVDRCAEAFVAAGQPSPLPYLLAAEGDWSQVEIQAAQFSHAAGLANLWRSCGLVPDATVGHSLGEVAAAYVAGGITLADAAAVVVARATAVDRLSGGYGMASLGISLPETEQLIATIPGWLEMSAVNAGTSVVVSGERAAIDTLVAAATDRGQFARRLDVDYPGHTSALESLREDLAAMLPDARFADAPIRFIGSTTGDMVPAGTAFGDYWYENLRRTVRFDRAIATARGLGVDAFVEMSAHPSLLFALGDLLGDDESTVVGSGHRDVPSLEALSQNIAAVAVADPGYRWADLVDVAAHPHLRGFPNAPMRDVRLWAEPRRLAPIQPLTVAHETWSATTASADRTERRVAVVDVAGPSGPLSDRLRAALTRRDHIKLVDAADADLVVAVAPTIDEPDVERATAALAGLLDDGLLDYVDTAGTACRAVCLVTAGGERVRAGEPSALPAQSALAAMHRSIGFEHPELAFRHLDLPSWEPDDASADAAVDALLASEPEIAVRLNGSQAELLNREVTESVEPAPPFPAVDDVVITGGNGAVGLHFARYLAAHGARRIVLLSRGGVDDATLAGLAAPGVEVVAARCDVSSAADVAEAARRFGKNGASLLIHAAGAATFADRPALTGAALTDTAAAKIAGLARMTEQWPLRPDARILVCSSVSGVWGGRSHAAYSAANRLLDAMAAQLRAGGTHCVAARYGLWRGSGIAGAGEVTRIERSGLLAMDPERAVEASLCEYRDDPLLYSADRDRLQLFRDSAATTENHEPATISGDTAAQVRAEIAAVLGQDAASVDMATSLLDLGVDSLLALDLRKRLQRVTGHKVALGTLLGGITGDELIADLDTKRSEKVDTRD